MMSVRVQRSEDAGASCFELLGFDVLLDHKLKPFLLEVVATDLPTEASAALSRKGTMGADVSKRTSGANVTRRSCRQRSRCTCNQQALISSE